MKPFCTNIFVGLLTLLLVASSCVEPYSPPEISGNPDFLVIDAFLNATDNSCRVRLSRAVSISSEESSAPLEETPGNPVIVMIEDEQGTSYLLDNVAPGTFESISLPLDLSRKYRLSVKVSSAEQYVSDFVEIKQTPGIEKVFFDATDEELRIFVNSEEAGGQGNYYRWTWEETWEYTSPYPSLFKLQDGEAVLRPNEEQIYRCYRTDPLQKILVASSTELDSDVIKNFLIQTIPRTSQRLQHRYSINVRQMALTEDAYTYWLSLFKTTENVGGLFDPMPGEVTGNFHHVSNPAAKVIGYFSAATTEEKRIFISTPDLPVRYSTFQHVYCELDTVLNELIPRLDNSQLLVSPVYSQGFPVIIGFTTSNQACIDCRVMNRGVLDKPPFWP